MRKYYLSMMVVLLALMVGAVSCNNNPVVEDPYVGDYNFRMITDSLSTDGLEEWFSAEEYAQMTGQAEDDMFGVMTISKTGDIYSVFGALVDEDDTVELFSTIGKLDAQKNLVLNNSTTTVEETGVTVDFKFRKIAPPVDNVLTFKVQMDMHLGSMLFGYIMTTIAEKE